MIARSVTAQQFLLFVSVALLAIPARSGDEPVAVRLTVERGTMSVGETNYLTASASVKSSLKPGIDRILTFSVDLINDFPSIATLLPGDVVLPTADPDFSIVGVFNGDRIRAISGSFLSTPGAGVDNSVILFRSPFRAVKPGLAAFSVGNPTVGPLTTNFMVAPIAGDTPLFGADFSVASTTITVLAKTTGPILSMTVTPQDPRFLLHLRSGAPSTTYVIESSPSLAEGSWEPLLDRTTDLGGSFSVSISESRVRQFYRAKVGPAR